MPSSLFPKNNSESIPLRPNNSTCFEERFSAFGNQSKEHFNYINNSQIEGSERIVEDLTPNLFQNEKPNENSAIPYSTAYSSSLVNLRCILSYLLSRCNKISEKQRHGDSENIALYSNIIQVIILHVILSMINYTGDENFSFEERMSQTRKIISEPLHLISELISKHQRVELEETKSLVSRLKRYTFSSSNGRTILVFVSVMVASFIYILLKKEVKDLYDEETWDDPFFDIPKRTENVL